MIGLEAAEERDHDLSRQRQRLERETATFVVADK
jgi:hypothetical protein